MQARKGQGHLGSNPMPPKRGSRYPMLIHEPGYILRHSEIVHIAGTVRVAYVAGVEDIDVAVVEYAAAAEEGHPGGRGVQQFGEEEQVGQVGLAALEEQPAQPHVALVHALGWPLQGLGLEQPPQSGYHS